MGTQSASHRFELLTYIWCDGFRSYVFDEQDKPLVFDSIEEAVAELQEDFDIWARQLRDGKRGYDFDPSEFRIKCLESNERCDLELFNGKLRLVSIDDNQKGGL